jgi:hypothetical protein
MRSLKYILCFLPLFGFSQTRQVHYWYFAEQCHAIGYHSGKTALELRADFNKIVRFGRVMAGCPYHPIVEHTAPRDWGPGTEAIWLSVDGVFYSGQCNNISTDGTTGEACALMKCRGCNNGTAPYYMHKIVTLGPDHPLNRDWVWNGEAQRNRFIRNYGLELDQNGDVSGHNFTLKPPFGGVLANPELGVVGTGHWEEDLLRGPYWDWNDDIIPPVDPENLGGTDQNTSEIAEQAVLSNLLLGEIAESVASSSLTQDIMLDDMRLFFDKFDVLQDSISTWYLEYLDYIAQPTSGGMTPSQWYDLLNGTIIPELDAQMAIEEAQRALLQKINDGSSTVQPVEDESGMNQDLVEKQDHIGEALDTGIRDTVTRGRAFYEDFADIFYSVFGNWRSLPSNVKPQAVLDFEIPLLGRFIWDLGVSVPQSWWDIIKVLRSFEVLGLFAWLLWRLSYLFERLMD